MLEINKVYNIDCLDGLKQLEYKSVTISFTDPPYNLGKDYGAYKDNRQDYLQWMSQVINEMKRVSQKGYTVCIQIQIPSSPANEKFEGYFCLKIILI